MKSLRICPRRPEAHLAAEYAGPAVRLDQVKSVAFAGFEVQRAAVTHPVIEVSVLLRRGRDIPKRVHMHRF